MQIFSNQTDYTNLNQPQEAIQALEEFLSILDENYGEDRDIYGDLGGYAVLAESKQDIQTIQTQIIKGTVPEDVEILFVRPAWAQSNGLKSLTRPSSGKCIA